MRNISDIVVPSTIHPTDYNLQRIAAWRSTIHDAVVAVFVDRSRDYHTTDNADADPYVVGVQFTDAPDAPVVVQSICVGSPTVIHSFVDKIARFCERVDQ